MNTVSLVQLCYSIPSEEVLCNGLSMRNILHTLTIISECSKESRNQETKISDMTRESISLPVRLNALS